MEFHLLLIDDDELFSKRLKELIQKEKRKISSVYDGKSAIEFLKNEDVDIVLLDEKLPDTTGLELLQQIKKNYPSLIIIMVTAANSISLAVQSIQFGAYHYVLKPFKIEEFENIINIALEKIALERKLNELQSSEKKLDKPSFISESPKIKEIITNINKLIGIPYSSILITGETGTGKGNLAKYIHWLYFKKMSKFIHISCADISSNLLETELFGYSKGAFTDAKNEKPGLFELANGGTLFLDEIDAFPEDLQKKLLYFLDTKKIRRVGSTNEIECDVRLITATNANLESLVNDKKFRTDLFYRLNMIHIHLPPLRERKEDIKQIADYFKDLFNLTFNKNILGFSNNAYKLLENHNWIGNVRELKNIIEKAMIFCNGLYIEEKDISLDNKNLQNMTSFDTTLIFPATKKQVLPLKKLEEEYVKHVLKLYDNNKTLTAEALQITRQTLISWLKEI